MIIGITGSIGSGKTTAAKIFGRYWYTRIDADEIGHDLLKFDEKLKKKIVKEFGNGVLDKNKHINRKKLGDIVFNDNKKLNKLNSIMHPVIINEIKKKISQIKKECKEETKIIIDAPLLVETNLKNCVDKNIVVKANEDEIIKRLSKKYNKEKIERILKAQMPLEEKLKYADFVIDNNKDLRHLEKQVKNIIKKLK